MVKVVWSRSFRSCSNQVMWAAMRGRTALVAAPRRFFSETSSVITGCLWAVRELSSWVSASRRGRTGGWIASAKWASTAASRASVLANFPVALAKSRTWRGLTTTTGSASAARAATSGSSRPPVASSSTNDGPMTVRGSSSRQPTAGFLLRRGEPPISRPWAGRQRPPWPLRRQCLRRFLLAPCLPPMKSQWSTGPFLHDAGSIRPSNCSGSLGTGAATLAEQRSLMTKT